VYNPTARRGFRGQRGIIDRGEMQTTRIRLAVGVVCCVFAFPAAAAFGQGSNEGSIVEQARADYYNLPEQGFKAFHCDVRVDWNAVLVSQNGDTAGSQELIPLLRQTHFEAVVGARGAPLVSLVFDGPAPNEDVAARVRAASAGVQRSLSGALDEFSSLLLGSPLPPDGNYHVEDQGDRVRITFGSDEVRIVETMNKNHAIEEMIIATQHSTVTVRPQFKRGEKGFLPAVIDSSVEAAGADKVESHVAVAYQTVEGFDLPQTVSVRDKQLAGGAPVQFGFSNYQVTR
jgi:hypothetical protein